MPTDWTDEEQEAMTGGDPFKGIGQYMSAETWTLAAPLRLGMQILKRDALVDLSVQGEQQVRRRPGGLPDLSPLLLRQGDARVRHVN